MKSNKVLLLLFTSFTLVLVGLIFSIPDPAQAQCGSSASSCKTCHETQGQDPVNTEGDWHTQHAFGDFCEFCHAGNVQATEKEAAHEGLAAPLEDVAASCQGCHPQDLTERADIYASTLGVELGGGGSTGATGGDSGSGGGDTSGGGDSAANSGPVTGVAAPLGGEEIDFNLIYAEQTAPKPLIENWANIILILMIVGVGAAFFITAWTWEGWGKFVAAWVNNNVTVVSNAVIEAGRAAGDDSAPEPDSAALPGPAQLAAALEDRPELRRLWPKLSRADKRLLRDLNQILSDEKQGAELLRAVSRLDLKLAQSIKQLNPNDRELLLALANEM